MDLFWHLWLPILLSAVALHFASFVLWAASPWHNADVKQLPDQAAFDAAFNPLGLKPGFYMSPCTHDPKEMKAPAFVERYNAGPWTGVTVFTGKPNMGRNLGLTFLVFLVASALIALLASLVLVPGAPFVAVFRFVAIAGVLAYTFGGMTNGILFGKPLGWTLRDIVDALIYACITAALFAWLWPGAPTPALP